MDIRKFFGSTKPAGSTKKTSKPTGASKTKPPTATAKKATGAIKKEKKKKSGTSTRVTPSRSTLPENKSRRRLADAAAAKEGSGTQDGPASADNGIDVGDYCKKVRTRPTEAAALYPRRNGEQVEQSNSSGVRWGTASRELVCFC